MTRAIRILASALTIAVLVGMFACKPETATVAALLPSFDPEEGTYFGVQHVTLQTESGGALIRYTTDGSIPREDYGLEYSGNAIVVDRPMTVHAIAYGEGYLPSDAASATYTISTTENPTVQAAEPTFSPAEGTYPTTQTVRISSTTAGASIRYTTDGSIPSFQYGVEYTGTPINVTNTSILNAVAYKEGYLDSQVRTITYTIAGTVANPTFSPPAGTYTVAQTVTLATITADATIWYTTDGTNPSPDNGNQYSGPIVVGTTTTLRVIAYKEGLRESGVQQGIYTIGATVAKPAVSVLTGTYLQSQTVSVTTGTPGASIRYTLDGSNPTASYGTLYAGPIPITRTRNLKAIAYKTGYTDSQVQSATYTIALDSVNNVGMYSAIAVDGTGVYIVHKDDSTPKNLKVTTSPDLGTTWFTGVADEINDMGNYASIKAQGGVLYVAEYDNTNGDLVIVTSLDHGVSWKRYTADSTGNVGQFASIAVDPFGDIYASYYEYLTATTGRLKFARSTDGGNTWTTSVVDAAAANVGKYTSIVTIGSSAPYEVVIAYYDQTNGDLKAARSTDSGATWPGGSIVAVDNTAGRDVGQYTSMGRDPGTGNLYVAYYELTQRNLKLATYAAAVWSTQTVVSTQDVGTYCSLYVDPSNGSVNVAYHNESDFSICLVRSTDAGGTWSASPIMIDGYPTGRYASLTGSGDGAELWVSYQEIVNFDLKAARSTDDGLTWEIF